MHTKWLFLTVFLLAVSSCAVSDRTDVAEPNPFAGQYQGTETLEGRTLPGGTFPLWFYISDTGRIRIVDVDGVEAIGRMEGNTFLVRRLTPRQVFEGTIEGGDITGTTRGNPYLGDGTFTATRQ